MFYFENLKLFFVSFVIVNLARFIGRMSASDEYFPENFHKNEEKSENLREKFPPKRHGEDHN